MRSTVLAFGLALGVVAVPGAASAAPQQATKIVDLKETAPAKLTDVPRTVTGRLVDAGGNGLADAAVKIEHGGLYLPKTATTGPDGGFSVVFTRPDAYAYNHNADLTDDGSATVSYPGDAGHEGSTSTLKSGRLGSRITLDKLTGPFKAGVKVRAYGTLELQRADGTWAKPATESVTFVSSTYRGGQVGKTTAEVTDGRFSGLVDPLVPNVDDDRYVAHQPGAVFDGGTDHAFVQEFGDPVNATTCPATLTAPERAYFGQEIELSGRLGWTPGTAQTVLVGGRKNKPGATEPLFFQETVRVGMETSFKVKARVAVGDVGEVYFTVSNTSCGTIASAQTSVYQAVWVDGLKASPSPVTAGKQTTLNGTVATFDPKTGKPVGVPGAQTKLEFSADKKSWQQVATGKANEKGQFAFTPTAAKDGFWRVTGLGDYKPSHGSPSYGQAEVYVDTTTATVPPTPPAPPAPPKPPTVPPAPVKKAATKVTANASPEPLRKGRTLKVSGLLSHWSGGHWKALDVKRVAVYYRVKGTSKWKFAGWATVGKNGRYVFKSKPKKDAYWRTVFAGDKKNRKATSAADFVDVR